jgi:hypothetical protein
MRGISASLYSIVYALRLLGLEPRGGEPSQKRGKIFFCITVFFVLMNCGVDEKIGYI